MTPILIALALQAPEALAETVVIEATADATIFEDADGGLANGAGPALFAGRTALSTDSIRRALLHFDVASHVPAHAEIVSARLVLHVESAHPGERLMTVHRLTSDWSEGGSFSGGGQGAPAGPGDATWLCGSSPALRWRQPGGDYLKHESAAVLAEGLGPHAWEGPRLVHDVRLWLQAPRRNFGWLLRGDESTGQTARRFTSRSGMQADRRPRLEVEYAVR